jgi:hypothetical protein
LVAACISSFSTSKIGAAENDIYAEIAGYKSWKQVHRPMPTTPAPVSPISVEPVVAMSVISPADVGV